MKPYYQLTSQEKLNLTNQEFEDAVKLEAIERRIAPPIPLSEAVTRLEYKGYEHPASSLPVFCVKAGYHGPNFGYLTQEKALAAMEGVVIIGDDYNTRGKKIVDETPELYIVHVGAGIGKSKGIKLEETLEASMSDEYSKLVDECVKDRGQIIQENYNVKVDQEKRAEFMRLARGDEEIARSFWEKLGYSRPWPAAPIVNPA